jgi:hypothetical protein
MNDVIYMPLMDEGTECWRPVHARRVATDIYEIAAGDKSDDEQWAFPNGSRLRCREHVFADGKMGFVALEIAN